MDLVYLSEAPEHPSSSYQFLSLSRLEFRWSLSVYFQVRVSGTRNQPRSHYVSKAVASFRDPDANTGCDGEHAHLHMIVFNKPEHRLLAPSISGSYFTAKIFPRSKPKFWPRDFWAINES